jgi:hypothetical protein
MKPKLTKDIDLESFKEFYWLKSELRVFCRKNGISGLGSKKDIENRIEAFIKTGIKSKPLIEKQGGDRDNKKLITLATPVVNYKNDAATREFFVEHIGSRFRFNAYLRAFNGKILKDNITYGDLVKGWLASETLKKKQGHQNKIDPQFEYNQFIRDFFKHEKGKTLREVIQEWKKVSAKARSNTYDGYSKGDKAL